MLHQEAARPHFDAVLSLADQTVIARAALLAYFGRDAEAEVVRFAAGYHNLKEASSHS